MLGQSRTMFAFLVILGWLTQGNAQDKAKIFVGASSKTLGYSPLWVATKEGFFDQQGLDVQLGLFARRDVRHIFAERRHHLRAQRSAQAQAT